MSFYSIVLFIHIFSAFGIGLMVFLSIYLVLFTKVSLIKPVSKYLGLTSLFQTFTGSLLMFLSSRVDLLNFCKNIAIYITVVLLTQYILFVKYRNTNFVYPYRFVIYSFSLTVFIAIFSILFFI